MARVRLGMGVDLKYRLSSNLSVDFIEVFGDTALNEGHRAVERAAEDGADALIAWIESAEHVSKRA